MGNGDSAARFVQVFLLPNIAHARPANFHCAKRLVIKTISYLQKEMLHEFIWI
jgi:hypothetical protein